MSKLIEPKVDCTSDRYVTQLSHAFSFYNMEKDKKDARAYMKTYLKEVDKSGKSLTKFEEVPDPLFVSTYGWLARIKTNGFNLRKDHEADFSNYVTKLLSAKYPSKKVVVEEAPKPSIQEYMQEKIKECIGELEGAIDNYVKEGTSLELYNHLKLHNIPKPYCSSIKEWASKRGVEFNEAYSATDGDLKEGYSNLGKRKLSGLVKLMNSFIEDLDKYSEFKNANRKPRVRKAKPASVQVAKLKYKKEDTDLNIKSVNPAEIVGASQVWLYNVKYKRIAVYRSDSTSGIQVKGTMLQNYEPEQSEQKSCRNPKDVIARVMSASKIQLRKIISDLTSKDFAMNGRLNEECIILRVIK